MLTKEDIYVMKLIKNMWNPEDHKDAINGFESLAILAWIDPAPDAKYKGASLVTILAGKAGISFDDAKSIVSGKETSIEMDGLKITVPVRVTEHQGKGI